MQALQPPDLAGTLAEMAGTMRRWIVEQSLASRVGHIGSALSVVDIVAALWGGVMRDPGTCHPERDRFLLGKGHAALALYGALRWCNLLDETTFRTYCGDDSPLGAHPEHGLPGIDASTGSLGQALSIGCGMALGLRKFDTPARVFVLMSDAECNEGQVWEAAMLAGHLRLARLTAVVDVNGMQAMGRTRDVLDMGDLAAKWRAFGWACAEVDGHSLAELCAALGAPPGDRPRVVLARTVLGHGVPFMEGRLEWHYRNLSEDLGREALAALEGQA